MFRILYAESDATFYEHDKKANTGLDEVLEIGKRLHTAGESLAKSRSAVKFNMTEVQNVLTKYSVSLDSCKFMLQLYTVHAKDLPAEYTIDANIAAQPWINGTGMLTSTPIKIDGASWAQPAASWSLDSQTYTSQSVSINGNTWITSNQMIRVNNSSLYVSGSGSGGSWLWQSGSGNFNSSFFNQSFFHQPGLEEQEDFSYRTTDINMDVTNMTNRWLDSTILFMFLD